MGNRDAIHDPKLGSLLRSARLGGQSSAKHAMKLIRCGGHREMIGGCDVHFTGAMLAGQFAHDRLRASDRSTVDVAAIRNALDELWKVRHYFDLNTATGYALGLGHADRMDAALAARS